MLQKGNTIAIVALSNGLEEKQCEKMAQLERVFKEWEIRIIWSEYMYKKDSIFNGEDEEKGKELMTFIENEKIVAIFDASGGDLANGVLEYIHFDIVKKHHKPFFGYSDLTVLLNGCYANTNEKTYLYQVKNLVGEDSINQQRYFYNTMFKKEKDLFSFTYDWIQGREMEGTLVGGNIRCFVKLAGTSYMPSFHQSILFLEAYSGDVGKMMTYLTQLKHLGVFQQINGILLGTFTEMEEKAYSPSMEQLVRKVVNNPSIPIAKTTEIGHCQHSKALIIGERMKL